MHQSNQIWYLMARSLSRESTPEEEAFLNNALQQNSALQQQYNILKSFWGSEQEINAASNIEGERKKISRILQLAKVQELLPQKEEKPVILRRILKRRRLLIKVIMYAGILLMVITTAWILLGKNDNNITKKAAALQERPQQIIATQNGSRTRTMLPDGTTVWLNAGSKIYFDNDFAGATRDVRLEGEAYFDVVKNPHRPFIVHTAGIDIRVLGTVFNVKSYPVDKTVETTLIRGLVQVTRQGYPQQKPIFLHPNQKLVVQKILEVDKDKAAEIEKKQPIIKYKLAQLDTTIKESDRLETAWVYNRLEFRGEDFETVAGKLERWYNVTIVFEDEKAKQLTFNGSFENETVEQAFTALKTASPFNFSISGHEIFIKSVTKVN